MKKIAIDARESGSTTGRYIDKLIEHLHNLNPQFEIVLLAKPHRIGYLKGIAPSFEVLEANFKEFTFDEQLGFKKLLKRVGADLVHFGMTQQPVLYRGKVVTTIHDLTTARFSNPDKNAVIYRVMQLVYRWVTKQVSRKSIRIISPSEFVKKDLVSFTGVNPKKIVVTYEAAVPIKDKADPIEKLLGKSFIMYVGRPMPHKNLRRLIEAYSLLKDKHPDLMLVLVGKKDNNYLIIENELRQKGIKGVVFTDFVSEGQLRWLYENTGAYIFPSLSEGFGLPPLEAMTHGAPVISSNATCLPEINGEAAYYFDPLNVAEMSEAISEVLTNGELRKKLVANGYKQIKKYSWQRMAQQTLEVYSTVLKEV